MVRSDLFRDPGDNSIRSGQTIGTHLGAAQHDGFVEDAAPF